MNQAGSKPGPVVLVGAGDLGRDSLSVFDALTREDRRWEVAGFLDDGLAPGTEVLGFPVLGGLEWLESASADLRVLITIGTPAVRRTVDARIRAWGRRYATVLHPSLLSSRWVEIGEGALIMGGCSVTVAAVLGCHVVLNPGCTVAHDVRIGDYSYLSPGVHLAGRVTLEAEAYLGTGAVVIPGRRIGRGATVGAGAVVIRDVPPLATAVGVPTRLLDSR